MTEINMLSYQIDGEITQVAVTIPGPEPPSKREEKTKSTATQVLRSLMIWQRPENDVEMGDDALISNKLPEIVQGDWRPRCSTSFWIENEIANKPKVCFSDFVY